MEELNDDITDDIFENKHYLNIIQESIQTIILKLYKSYYKKINIDIKIHKLSYNMIESIDIQKLCKTEIMDFYIFGLYYAETFEIFDYYCNLIKQNAWNINIEHLAEHITEHSIYKDDKQIWDVVHDIMQSQDNDRFNLLKELNLVEMHRNEILIYFMKQMMEDYKTNINNKFIQNIIETYKYTANELKKLNDE